MGAPSLNLRTGLYLSVGNSKDVVSLPIIFPVLDFPTSITVDNPVRRALRLPALLGDISGDIIVAGAGIGIPGGGVKVMGGDEQASGRPTEPTGDVCDSRGEKGGVLVILVTVRC